MPPRTNTERIEELSRWSGGIDYRMTSHADRIHNLESIVDELRQELHRLVPRLAVVETEHGELKRSRDLWGTRSFMIVMAVITAALGGAVGLLIPR